MSSTHWRLPTQAEFESLFEGGDFIAEQMHSVFDHSDDGFFFWSSTPEIGTSGEPCAARFSQCYVGGSPRECHERVRLVREVLTPFAGNKDTPLSRFGLSECSHYIVDTKTGLEWKVKAEPRAYTWPKAMWKYNGVNVYLESEG